MNEDFLIYDIKPGDTLASIAGAIGMTDDQLRDFHNRNCRRASLLWINGLAGISRMVIPKNYKNPQQIIEEKRRYLPSEKWSPEFLYPSYHVTETLKQAGEKSTEISYITDLEFTSDSKNGTVVLIKNHSHKKNGSIVDDKMGGLALAAMNAISPIIFQISVKGQLLGIADPEQVVKKFQQKRPDIEDFYIGETVQHYLNKFEENIQAVNYLSQQLLSPMHYTLLFPDLQLFYLSGTFQRKFSCYRNSFPVNCVLEVFQDFEDETLAVTEFRGKIEDNCSLPEMLRGIRYDGETAEPVDGEVSFTYKTSKKEKKLEEASIEITLLYDEEIYFEHNLTVKSV